MIKRAKNATKPWLGLAAAGLLALPASLPAEQEAAPLPEAIRKKQQQTAAREEETAAAAREGPFVLPRRPPSPRHAPPPETLPRPEPEEGQESVGLIRIPDLGTNEILEMLENLTGKPILRKQNLPAVKITFFSQTPMTRREAIMAVESLLSINGIAITEVGGDFLKAVPAPNADNEVPIMIDGSAFDHAPSEKVFTKFFYLDYLTTQEAVTLVQPLMNQGAPIVFEKANALLITDPLNNLQRIESILYGADRRPAQKQEILFFPLKHIAASEMAKRMQSFQKDSLKAQLENNTIFEADDRTNQLIVFTHPDNRQLITDMIGQLDVDVAPLTQTEIFPVQTAKAEDVVSLIEQIITGQQKAREDQKGGAKGAPPAVRRPPKAPPDQQPGLADTGSKSLQFSDYLIIVADPRANNIVASGTKSDLVALKDLIAKIDVLLAQVRIEVLIADVGLTKSSAFGWEEFDIHYVPGSKTADFKTGNQWEMEIGLKEIAGAPFGIAPFTIQDFTWEMVIRTAKRKSNIRILSAPTIITTHNQEASIVIGESRPLVTGTFTSSATSTGGTQTTVQYRDIGIELKVKPLIGSNGIIQMEIQQKVESPGETVTINENDQPIIKTRQASSFVSVGDEEMVVLGGLQSYDQTKSGNKHFILGEIPIIGNLLNPRSESNSRSEFIIFIKPKIIRDPKAAREDAMHLIEQHSDSEAIQRYLETGSVMPEEEPPPEEDRWRTRSRRH